MKSRSLGVCVAALIIVIAGAAVLLRLKSVQRLGAPGVKVSAVDGSNRLRIDLPTQISGVRSAPVAPTEMELRVLPADTTIAKQLFQAPDGFQTLLNVVLMGTDRTSIHKPEFCLTAQGWTIVRRETVGVPLKGDSQWRLPVRKFTTSMVSQDASGRPIRHSGVFLFWFVADAKLAVDHWTRVGWITYELLRRGVLPRWAYVTWFSTCTPGQEEATFERMQSLVGLAVPEFQKVLPPRPAGASLIAAP